MRQAEHVLYCAFHTHDRTRTALLPKSHNKGYNAYLSCGLVQNVCMAEHDVLGVCLSFATKYSLPHNFVGLRGIHVTILTHVSSFPACANGTDIAVVRLLLSRYPDSKLVVDKRGRTPLHFALGNAENPPTPPLVKLLAGEMGESTKWPDENAMLPIHYACAYGATVEVLTVLIHAWGESMQKTDSKGRIPLHYAMGNSHLKNSPHLVKCLLHLMPSCIDQLDAEKNLPLDLLSTKAESVEEEEFEARDAILMCLTHYLEAGPKTSIEFLTGIKKLPEWVRESAVIHPAVQTMLNNKISSRFPTMILMLDFYFLAAVIGFFVITSNQVS